MRALKISFIIDNSDRFIRDAERLVYSILTNTRFAASDLYLHLTPSVPFVVAEHFESMGINVVRLVCFDEKRRQLNKINQLPTFFNLPYDVIFLDTDMYVLQDFDIPNRAVIQAKVVDMTFPPIEVLQRIYDAHKLRLPDLVATDALEASTIAANWNGGFYYFPQPLIEKIYTAWANNAKSMLQQINLVPRQYYFCIDQMAMSLTVHQLGLPYENLPSNYNFPSHIAANRLHYFDAQKPIYILHHHGLLDKTNGISGRAVMREAKAAIAEANKQILHLSAYFEGYQENKTYTEAEKKQKLSNLRRILAAAPKKKIIFHLGSPKTGTTSLQKYLATQPELLTQHGIQYGLSFPPIGSRLHQKHHWLGEPLLTNDETALAENLVKDLKESPYETVIFSHEGLWNHRLDHSHLVRELLQIICEEFEVELVIYIRDQQQYLKSFYAQTLKNGYIPQFPYGESRSLNQLFVHPWFRKQVNYAHKLADIKNYMGKAKLTILPYEKGKTIEQFLNYLQISGYTTVTASHENYSYSKQELKLIRRLNGITRNYRVRTLLWRLCKPFLSMISPEDEPLSQEWKDYMAAEQEKLTKVIGNIGATM